MRTKDGHDLPVEKITADNYIVPKGEERFFHAKIEVLQFNPKTGAKISRPTIQVFGPKIYRTIMAKQLKRLGYTIEILHNPDEWLKAKAEKTAALRAEQAKAAKAAADAKRAEEMKAMREELRREMQAEQDKAIADAVAKALAASDGKKPGRPSKESKEND